MSLFTIVLEKNLEIERKVLEKLEGRDPGPGVSANICYKQLLQHQHDRVRILEQQVEAAYLSDGCDQD